MSDSQMGGRKGKGCRNNIYLLLTEYSWCPQIQENQTAIKSTNGYWVSDYPDL